MTTPTPDDLRVIARDLEHLESPRAAKRARECAASWASALKQLETAKDGLLAGRMVYVELVNGRKPDELDYLRFNEATNAVLNQRQDAALPPAPEVTHENI